MTKSNAAAPWQTPFSRSSNRSYEYNPYPSLTTPDMTMTIPEIMRNFASGLPLGGMNKPEYIGEGHDVEVEDDVLQGRNWHTLDLSEKFDIMYNSHADLKKIKQGIAERETAQRTAIQTKQEKQAQAISALIKEHEDKTKPAVTNS